MASRSTAEASPDELRLRVHALTTELQHARSTLKLLAKSTPLEFSVMQYNLLANYLGSNLEPWFLFCANLDEERRAHVIGSALLARLNSLVLGQPTIPLQPQANAAFTSQVQLKERISLRPTVNPIHPPS